MDHPNYKMKNVSSPVSANEINLRFAVLDLYQKLKKNEMFCEYYERCRNELIKDYLRLRQERDYYLYLLKTQAQVSTLIVKSSPNLVKIFPFDLN